MFFSHFLTILKENRLLVLININDKLFDLVPQNSDAKNIIVFWKKNFKLFFFDIKQFQAFAFGHLSLITM